MAEIIIDKNLLRLWYKSERNNVNYAFNHIMVYLDNRDILLNIPKQKFYDRFVEFCGNSTKNNYKSKQL